MTPILTPELVEKAARALFADEWAPAKISPHGLEIEWEDSKEYWTNCARAALTAVLPQLLEDVAAKVAAQQDARPNAEYFGRFIRQLSQGGE